MSTDTFNILMYSHDTYGLGHIRRTMAIATNLLQKDVNILILTGSPIAGRFDYPEGIDFVRIPGMIKESNTIYLPHSIKVAPQQAMNIRQNIITETAKALDPALFIVDKVPTGLKGECMPTLWWFKQSRPQTRIVLGLRDILDDAESTRADWKRKNFDHVLEGLYSEIWVYGDKDMYDPIAEYNIKPEIEQKTVFTGYIPRSVPVRDHAPPDCPYPFSGGNGSRPKVVVTTGGGGDGWPVLETYLTMLENNGTIPFDTLMIAGPFVPRDKLENLATRAEALGIEFATFVNDLESRIAAADLVISMGGYNTVCEILSMQQVALIIPRENPRKEQLIRAQVLKDRGLADYLPWNDMTPQTMREKITRLLKDSKSIRKSVAQFDMTGLDVMRSRLDAFRNGNN